MISEITVVIHNVSIQTNKQIESYNNQSTFSGKKSLWTILNNQLVKNLIIDLNNRGKARSISCFDFSTLYTTILCDKLIKVLFEIIYFCFKGDDKQFITVSKFDARWINNEKQLSIILSQSSLKFENKIFRQVIGIPMGSNQASFFASLSLLLAEKMDEENKD